MGTPSKPVVILSEATGGSDHIGKDPSRFTSVPYFCVEILRVPIGIGTLRRTAPLFLAEACSFPFDFQLSTFDYLHP